ncbi:hypothetical protein ES705_43246 [subsurface metagenome]
MIHGFEYWLREMQKILSLSELLMLNKQLLISAREVQVTTEELNLMYVRRELKLSPNHQLERLLNVLVHHARLLLFQDW